MERVAFKIISPDEISREAPYQTRYRTEDESLTRAVARYGMVQPLVVLSCHFDEQSRLSFRAKREIPKDGISRLRLEMTQSPPARNDTKRGRERQPEYVIISGHRRIHAARQLGLPQIPVLEIQNAVSPQDLFLLALLSNFNHVLSDLDKAWALRCAAEGFQFKEEMLFAEIMPCLGLAPEPHLLREHLDIAGLEPALLDRIADGDLPFRGVRVLARFSREDQITFAEEIASKVSLTTNQLLKTGEWLWDLLKFQRVSLDKFLQDNSLTLESFRRPKAVISSGARNPEKGDLSASPRDDTSGLRPRNDTKEGEGSDKRQQAEKFFKALWKLRFPNLAEQERQFEKFSREIQRECEDVTLEAPSHFEGEGFVLRAKIRRPDSLDEVVELVRRRRGSLNSLFDIVL